MKIALAIFRYFPYGGLQKDFMRIVRVLLRREHEVVCLCGGWQGEIPNGLRVVDANLKSKSNHGRAAEFEQVFQNFLQDEKPDVSLTFNRIGGADFYFAGDDCYSSLIEQRHNPFLYLFSRYKTYLRQERTIFQPGGRTKILYIADQQKKEYKRVYQTEESRFIFLPPSGDTACVRTLDSDGIRAAKRTELGVGQDQILLLQVAADFHCKGTDRVIECVSRLPEAIRKKVFLCLVGEVSDKRRKKFEETAKAAGIGGQTKFTGPRNDVNRYLLAADLMVHPPRKEAAGTVLVEALSCGLPVLCSALCGYAGIVEQAGCPVLPEPYAAGLWTAELTRILSGQVLLSLKNQLITHPCMFTPREETAADILEKFVTESR